MEKKSINFWKTSNMPIEINKMWCEQCQEPFYEIDDHELEECPNCGYEFYQSPSKDDWDSETYTLIVDHKTGVPSVIRNDEYEPVLRDSAIVPTESAQAQAGGRKGSGGSHE